MGRALRLVCVLLAASVGTPTSAGPHSSNGRISSEPTMSDAAKALHALFAAEWDYHMEQNPTEASTLGDRRWNDRWENLTLAAIENRHQHDLQTLSRLRSIDRSRLSSDDQLNYALFEKQYKTRIEGFEYRWYLIPLNQRGGIQTADDLANQLRFSSLKDYEDWIARLRSFSAHVDQTMALMREGMRQGMMLPKVIMRRIPAQIDKQVVASPEASPFYKPFLHFPASISEADQARLIQSAKQTVSASVVPAFVRFKKFFVEDYLPACFDQVGIWQNPNGAAMYAFLAREHTTTDLTPQQIHAIGLREVERIHGEMLALMRQVAFGGTVDDFFKFLRTDPRFFYKSPDELLEAYRATAKRIDPNLIKAFRVLPRTPYGVEPIPAEVAPDTTAAYYSGPAADGSRAGIYYVNLYKPETRPKWEMMALSLHESVPGHHLQIALGMEQGGLPNFRRYGYYDAFGEGWGLYAESLGYEMGLYDDPYSRFGQLTYDMWRAVRLVIDTGIHTMRWDRKRAIDYFMQNAAKTELDVTNEVDRYIAWPGQALAYKIGQLKIRELRDRSSQELGSKFDLKEFHEVVLKDGALPLDILERKVDEWIKSKQETT